MHKFYIIFIVILSSHLNLKSQVELNHNIGSTIVDQLNNASCSFGNVNWARRFVLSDFGIVNELTITQVDFGIQETGAAPSNGAILRIYAIDEDFPASFNNSVVLAESENIPIPSFSGRQIISHEFTNPVIVPADVSIILVELFQLPTNNVMFMGGTEDSLDFSWIRTGVGCLGEEYQTTADLNRPNVNYYIKAIGNTTLNIGDNKSQSITLSPNPVIDKLSINTTGFISNNAMKIYDMNGKILFSGIKKEHISISHFTPGVYFVRIENELGFQVRTFIKR